MSAYELASIVQLEGSLAVIQAGFGLIVDVLIKAANKQVTESFEIPGDLIGPVVGEYQQHLSVRCRAGAVRHAHAYVCRCTLARVHACDEH